MACVVSISIRSEYVGILIQSLPGRFALSSPKANTAGVFVLMLLMFLEACSQVAPAQVVQAPWRPPEVRPLDPSTTIRSSVSPREARFFPLLTIRVLGQVHEHPTHAQAPSKRLLVNECQKRIVVTVLTVGRTSAQPVLIAEGLRARGSPGSPSPWPNLSADEWEPHDAKYYHAHTELVTSGLVRVYGFEDGRSRVGVALVRRLDELLKRMRDAVEEAKRRVKEVGQSEAESQESLHNGLTATKAEYSRCSLAVNAISIQRSGSAVSEAALVAQRENRNEVWLLIGKNHWPDITHFLTSDSLLLPVPVQAVFYPCDG